MNDDLPEIVSAKEAAYWLNVSDETIDRCIKDGRLVAVQIEHGYGFRREDLVSLSRDPELRPPEEYRIYSDEEIAQFLEDDKLDEETLRIVEKFNSAIARNDAGG